MRDPLRVAHVVIAAIVVLSLLPAGVQAVRLPTGRLYLTDSAYRAPLQYINCGAIPYYNLSDEAPASGKAYVASSAPPNGCPIYFDYELNEPTTLQGNVTVGFAHGCEQRTIRGGVDTDGEGLAIGYVELQHGNERLDDASIVVGPDQAVCEAGDAPMPMNVTLQIPVARRFQEGDILRLRIDINAGPSAYDAAPLHNVYVPVGGDAPAHVTGPGIPGKIIDRPELLLDATPSSIPVAPGDVAHVTLGITNPGSANQSYALTVQDLPDGFASKLDPASGTIPPNGSTSSRLRVEIPDDAKQTTVPLTVAAETSGAVVANATVKLEVDRDASMLTLEPARSKIPLDGTALTELTLRNRADRTVLWEIASDGTPDGVDVAFQPAKGDLAGGSSRTVRMQLEGDPVAREQPFTVRVTGHTGASDSKTLSIVPPGAGPSGSAGAASTPGPSALAAVVAVGAAILARQSFKRRRR